MENPKVDIFSSRSDVTRLGHVIRSIFNDLPRAASLGWTLAVRDFKLRYMRNALGYVWVLLSPLLYAFIFVVVRHGMKGAGLHIDTGGIHPGLFALVGIVLFQGWLEGLMTQLEILRSNKNIVRAMSVPAETFFIAGLLFSGFGLLARLGIVALGLIVLGEVPKATWWQFPLWSMAAMVTGSAIGYLLSLIANFYRDIRTTLQSISLGILLVSPVFYPPTTNPEAVLYYLNIANPFGATMATARDSLLGGSLVLFGPALVWSGVLFILVLAMSIVNRITYRIVSERLM